jgi:hypothetical protein
LQFKTAYPNIKIKLYKKGGKVSKWWHFQI